MKIQIVQNKEPFDCNGVNYYNKWYCYAKEGYKSVRYLRPDGTWAYVCVWYETKQQVEKALEGAEKPTWKTRYDQDTTEC